MKSQFQINYKDEDIFIGSSFNGDWNLIDDKPIESITISLLGKKLKLENYEEYNHCLLNEVSTNFKRISHLFIMGRSGYASIIFDFNLIKGVVEKRVTIKGLEYNGQVITGWKKGVKNKETKVYYER